MTVIIAFLANVAVGLAKTFAALLTGSASMAAEAAHSWADVGNECFLLVADRRQKGGPNESHPLGYGREAYIWSMIAALGLFTAGGVVSVMRGIQELVNPEPGGDYTVCSGRILSGSGSPGCRKPSTSVQSQARPDRW